MARKKTPLEIAEKRIAKAMRDGDTSLYLVGNQLSTSPESLGQLTQLQSLILSRNQLSARR